MYESWLYNPQTHLPDRDSWDEEMRAHVPHIPKVHVSVGKS